MFQRPSLHGSTPRRPKVTRGSSSPLLIVTYSPNPAAVHLARSGVWHVAGRQPKRAPPALLSCRLGPAPPPTRPRAAGSSPRLVQWLPRRAMSTVSAPTPARQVRSPARLPLSSRCRRRAPSCSRAERRGGAVQRCSEPATRSSSAATSARDPQWRGGPRFWSERDGIGAQNEVEASQGRRGPPGAAWLRRVRGEGARREPTGRRGAS